MQHTNAFDRNITLFKVFWMFRDPLFWAPILISYLNHVGHMSIPSIYAMEAIVVMGLVILEIPTGALADLIGRKRTMLIGFVLNIVGLIALICASTPLVAWTSNIVWTIGAALISGADTSLLFESLQKRGREGEFKKVLGRVFSSYLIFVGFGSLVAGFLYDIHPRLPMLLSLPGMIAAFVSVILMKEANGRGKYVFREQVRLMKESVRFVLGQKQVLWAVSLMMLVTGVSRVWFFTYNPYYELVHLDVRWYGVAFFLMNVISWGTSRWAHEIEERFGERASFACMVAFLAVPILLMGSFVMIPMAFMTLLQSFVRGYERPFFDYFMHSHVHSENRATVLSVQSAARGFASSVGLWLFGGLLLSWSLPASLQLLGIVAGVGGALFLMSYKRVFHK